MILRRHFWQRCGKAVRCRICGSDLRGVSWCCGPPIIRPAPKKGEK